MSVDMGVDAVLPDMLDEDESVPEVAEGVVVLELSGETLVGPGGVDVGGVAGPDGVLGPCANALGAAAASMAATALATAQFLRMVRVCIR